VRNPRLLVAAGVVLVAVVAGVLLLTGADGDAPAPTASTATQAEPPEPLRTVRAKLTLEQTVQGDSDVRELLVSLPGPQFNTPEVARGAATVSLRCFDRDGDAVFEEPVNWPLPEEAGYPPHIHRPSFARELAAIRRCRVTAPGIDYEGRVSGRLPTFG
jgi:hypothetical protein